jgi:hypothetical protein
MMLCHRMNQNVFAELGPDSRQPPNAMLGDKRAEEMGVGIPSK